MNVLVLVGTESHKCDGDRCEVVYRNCVEAVSRITDANETVSVEKVSDPEIFFQLGVYRTPAIVIDGKIAFMGKKASTKEIELKLRQQETSSREH